MSQIRPYLDEDSMRRSLVFGLRARNVDVVTAADAEMAFSSIDWFSADVAGNFGIRATVSLSAK